MMMMMMRVKMLSLATALLIAIALSTTFATTLERDGELLAPARMNCCPARPNLLPTQCHVTPSHGGSSVLSLITPCTHLHSSC